MGPARGGGPAPRAGVADWGLAPLPLRRVQVRRSPEGMNTGRPSKPSSCVTRTGAPPPTPGSAPTMYSSKLSNP